jgi:hypothetical protein
MARRRNPSTITKRLKALERAAGKATTQTEIMNLHRKANDLSDVAYKAAWEQVDPQTPAGKLTAAVGAIVEPMYAEISSFKQWLTDVAEPARQARVDAARSAEMKALRDQMRGGDPYAAELRLAASRWKQNPKRRRNPTDTVDLGRAVRLTSGGYAPGKYGQYFGYVRGTSIYPYEAEIDGRYKDGHLRAHSRAAARKALQDKFPGAKVSK